MYPSNTRAGDNFWFVFPTSLKGDSHVHTFDTISLRNVNNKSHEADSDKKNTKNIYSIL